LFFAFIIFSINLQSCLTQGFPTNKETIPINWSDWNDSDYSQSERTWSQIVKILDRNIKYYRYFVYSYKINENSKESSWKHEISISTFADGEIVLMVFNYFSIQFSYSNDSELKVNGIPSRIATVRGSVNELNSLLDRITLLLGSKEFNDPVKYFDDLYWLENLCLTAEKIN